MKAQNTLNTDDRLFLVKFAWTSRDGKFITDTENLGKVIKENKNGIEYIKEFDPIKNRFKAISKKNLAMVTGYHTETHLELEKQGLI